MSTKTVEKNGKGELHTIEVGRQVGEWSTTATDQPYQVEVTLRGTSSLVFHRWAVDDGDGPAPRHKAKTDDVEGYVYRDENGNIALPGIYVQRAMVNAAKWRKDPRSKASALKLFEAALIVEPELASLGSSDWDYLDRRRAVVQRAGITRTRPAFKAGWEASLELTVLMPEYITAQLAYDVLADAGKFVGVGDMRPSYGRFAIVRFEVA